MTVARSRTFRSGNSQAVRLPKDIAFADEVELVVVRSGDVITMYPATRTIAELVNALQALPSPDRIEVRDEEPPPEPSGL